MGTGNLAEGEVGRGRGDRERGGSVPDMMGQTTQYLERQQAEVLFLVVVAQDVTHVVQEHFLLAFEEGVGFLVVQVLDDRVEGLQTFGEQHGVLDGQGVNQDSGDETLFGQHHQELGPHGHQEHYLRDNTLHVVDIGVVEVDQVLDHVHTVELRFSASASLSTFGAQVLELHHQLLVFVVERDVLE
jgi:hypothetical protein